jgi:hypothetical protein
MNRELTKKEEEITKISEQKNPYDKVCPDRHLWSEGFRSGFDYATQQLPSDEEIEKQFPVHHQNNLMTIVNGHRQEGAKWMRDKK